MDTAAAFTRTLERSGARLLIRSACVKCGDSKLVSKHDGSLQEWEDGHRCADAGLTRKGPRSVPGHAELRLRKVAGGKSHDFGNR